MRKKSIIIGIFLSVICAISVPVFAMDGDTGMNDKEHDTVIFDEMVNQDVVEDEANEGIQHDSESVEEVVENEDSVEMSNDFESTEENTVQVESNPDQAIVTIPDEQLRIRIKRQLNLTLDDEITVARMKELTQISTISYGDVSNLEGLQYAVNLEGYITIQGTSTSRGHITDLTPLSQLTKITGLNLMYNDIEDLTPLSNLTNLTVLTITNNKVKSLHGLENLNKLEYLHVWSNQIESLDPLENITSLKDVILDQNKFTNLNGLRNSRNLERVKIVYGLVEDISGLENMESLTSVQIQGTNLADLTPLANAPKLTNLNVSHNKIVDFSPIPASVTTLRGDNQTAEVTLHLTGPEYAHYLNTSEITNTFHRYNYESLPLIESDAVTMVDDQTVAIKDSPLEFDASFNNMDGKLQGNVHVTIQIPQFHVSFDPQNGNDMEQIEDVDFGSRIDTPVSPTRAGYTFAGWYVDDSFTEKWDFMTDKVEHDIILFAKWNLNPIVTTKYQVTYVDGVADAIIFADQEYLVEEGAITPDYVGLPTRSGYVFKGWSPEIADTVTENQIYTAQWERIETVVESPAPKLPNTGIANNTLGYFVSTLGITLLLSTHILKKNRKH
ncbi:InlB B-repeat-containing protein [Erysipelothrix sp. HDW6C]|uniref:InlB B-repeat-containing protein n=1 Tax=Erysipelothrix sp. HDW6C TaxID=2714930 RepID=UPI001F10682B|nr:InlB B-repeat-containing protein [Erysipelothrix sp. HDW6C]